MNKYELYYQVAQSHLSEQDGRDKQLEFKASATVGFSATLLGLAALTLGKTAGLAQVGAIVMVFGFVLAAAPSLIAFWIYNWRRDPHLSDLAGHLNEFDVGALPPLEVSGLVRGRLVWARQIENEPDPRRWPNGRYPAHRRRLARIVSGASIFLCRLAQLLVGLSSRLSSPPRASSRPT